MSISTPHSNVLDASGWLSSARQLPSPNCDVRPDGMAIELIVIHNISLPPGVFDGDAVIALFTNRLDWDAHPYYQGIRGIRHVSLIWRGEPPDDVFRVDREIPLAWIFRLP